MPYIYDADTYCDSCGEEIKARILASATDEERERFQDEHDYDSGEFPKWMSDDEESDCPQHCACQDDCLEAEVLPDGTRIGALLSTSLTTYGAEYVKTAVAEGGPVAEFWREQFSWIDFPPTQEDIAAAVSTMERSEIVDYLEGVSIECRENESLEILREALIVNVLDGTIEKDWIGL